MEFYFKSSTLKFLVILGMIIQTGIPCQSAKNLQPPLNMIHSEQEINLQIGNRTFAATLEDNAATIALVFLLPLTLNMEDLNRNEKFAPLPKNLPTQSFSPENIQNGDLLLWGANTVVIFYESFSSSYAYTRLGKIDDPSGLKEALGTGNVKVVIELTTD